MDEPTPDQPPTATQEPSGVGPAPAGLPTSDSPADMSAQEAANRSAMDIVTPEFRAQVNAVEMNGSSTAVNPTEPDVGVESRPIDKLPDPYDTQAVESFREQKRLDMGSPGE